MKKRERIIFYIVAICGLIVISTIALNINKPKEKLNILLITLDALRPDHLGCYGYQRNTSPAIDSIASSGTIFMQVIAQSPFTLDSVPSFYTSAYPYEHPNYFTGDFGVILNDKTVSLSKILKQHGYRTFFITNHQLHLGKIEGLLDNFDFYIGCEEKKPREITQRAVKCLRENKDKRFFLWLYFMSPHGPYNPSEPYIKDFYVDALSQGKNYLPVFNLEHPGPQGYFNGIPDYIVEDGITEANYYIAKYDAKLRIADDLIAGLIESLKELGLYDNTLIVIMSDHGESLGEHDYYFNHGLTMYDEVLRVPLIIRLPGIVSKGKRISSQVCLLDLTPTIIEAAGITQKYKSMRGKSLLDCILEEETCGDRYVFSNMMDWTFSIRTEKWKLIHIRLDIVKNYPLIYEWLGNHYKNEYEFYNLESDPLEKHDLLIDDKLNEEENAGLLDLSSRLKGYEQGQQDYFRSYPKKKTLRPEADAEEKEKLKSLGYVQ